MTTEIEGLRDLSEAQTSQIINFSRLNFKEVDIGEDKIAWTFFKIRLDEEYGQIGAKEYPSYFYLKTESGNIYKIFRKDYKYLQQLCNTGLCEHIMSTFPTDRCIYNPQKRTVTGVEYPTITCGQSFTYAPKCQTSPIKEIVGVAGSRGSSRASLTSAIEQEFMQKTS